MDGGEGSTASEPAGPTFPPGNSIGDSVERLIASGKEVVAAEIAWARLKGLDVIGRLRRVMLLATISVVSLIVGLTLLLVAAVVALVPLVGLLAAILIVSVTAFVVTALFGFLARRAFSRMLEEMEP